MGGWWQRLLQERKGESESQTSENQKSLPNWAFTQVCTWGLTQPAPPPRPPIKGPQFPSGFAFKVS